MRPSLHHIAIWLLAALPAVLALMFVAPSGFSSAGTVLNILGRLSGIWGLACLLVAGMLSCRAPGFDQPFGGLTKLWQLHHKLGLCSYVLLLAHPLLLAFAEAEVSLAAAVASLFSTRLTVLYGWLALLTLMVVMLPTFHIFGTPDYQRWKYLHRVTGVTVVFAFLHSIMLGRTFPESWNISIWLGFGLLTLSAMLYRWVVSRYYGRYRYRVDKVVVVADNVVELTLVPLAKPMRYRPGQFVYLTPKASQLSAGNGEEHPYTLSSAPEEPVLRLSIKGLGDASQALQHIAVGSNVLVEGPYGSFFPLTKPSGGSLWIAGGIGIVPFLSYLRHLAAQGSSMDVLLIYCVEDQRHMLFADELSQLTSRIAGCRLTTHFFSHYGALDSGFVLQHCADVSARKAWICGPPALICVSRGILLSAGIVAADIVTEEFSLL